MGFFSKRKKLKIEDIPLPKEFTKKLRSDNCPDILRHTNLCACVDCPKRDVCVIETISKASTNCKNFVRYCSAKNALLSGEGNLSKYALEEFYEYLDGRYL